MANKKIESVSENFLKKLFRRIIEKLFSSDRNKTVDKLKAGKLKTNGKYKYGRRNFLYSLSTLFLLVFFIGM
jgi:hypothetical protein